MTDRARRIRTGVSALLLLSGCACLRYALTSPATWIVFGGDVRGLVAAGPEVWVYTSENPAFLPTLYALVAAPACWAGAAWFRSAWARWGGFLLCGVSAVVVGGLLLAHRVPSSGHLVMSLSSTRVVPASGWAAWAVAGTLLAASFLVLPPPVRPAPGEANDPSVIRRARRRSAAAACAFAVLGMLSFYALDGASKSFRTPLDVAGATLMVLPLVFLIAWFGGVSRWFGTIASSVLAGLMVVHRPPAYPWSSVGFAPPQLVLWHGVGVLFLVAFLLLPPPRSANPA